MPDSPIIISSGQPARQARLTLLAGLTLALALALALGACGSDGSGEEGGATPPSETTTTTDGQASGPIETTDIATDLEVPWGIDFLPNGDALVTERDSGRLLRIDGSGEPTEVQSIEIDPSGEGGLLGLAVSPDYSDDGLIYAYYSREGQNRIARFQLGAEPETIVDGIEASSIHNGGRLSFGPDGMLFASTGDAGDGELAQNPDSLNGKILRMSPEGDAPPDNPTAGSLVYSLGHRNVEGLAFDADGQLFASEFGENDFDEVNRIEAGANYGWPEVEGEGGAPELTEPIQTWRPSEASPAGAAIPSKGFAGPDRLAGRMLVATLAGERLYSLGLGDDGGVSDERELLGGELGRLRTVVQTPEGELWLATSNQDGRGSPSDGDDRIVRLEAGG